MARATAAAIRKAHVNGTDGAYNTNTNATVDPDRSTTPLLTYAKQAISLPYALAAAIPRAPEHDRGHEHEHDHNEDDDTRPTPPPFTAHIAPRAPSARPSRSSRHADVAQTARPAAHIAPRAPPQTAQRTSDGRYRNSVGYGHVPGVMVSAASVSCNCSIIMIILDLC